MFKRLVKAEIFKDVFTLIIGTVIAYSLQVIFQMILRRVYDVDDLGLFDLYLSFVSICLIFSTLRYEFAIVQPDDNDDAANMIVGIAGIALVVSILIFTIITLLPSEISNLLNFPREKYYWLYFLPMSSFTFSIYQGVNYWLIRNKKFRSSSINKISRRATEGVVQSTLGYLGISMGLVIGDIIGNLANVLSGIIQMKNAGFSFKVINTKSIKSVLSKYSNFPKIQAFPSLINTISLFLPLLMVNKFYDPDTLGYFSFSRNMLMLPVALVSASVSQVLLKDFAEKRRKNIKVTTTFLHTSLTLFLIFIPVILIVVFLGPWLFALVFSDKYINSGIYSQILVFAVMLQFVVSPVSIFFTAFEKLKVTAVWQIGYFLLVGSLFFFKECTIIEFIKIYTIINIFAYLVYWLLIYFLAKKNDKNLLSESKL